MAVPKFGCSKYSNTASITQTSQSSGQTVSVCGPIFTAAQGMGYWQNKNGQGIITGGASTLGVCNSGTWLRQYAPYQDLSATATCRQVAQYVVNVIKNANSSGSSMNPMLKAQMLGTGLDTYFSDPALGGNILGAPSPIGGVAIDLTMISGASGSFGGATSLTVSQTLAFAASQSNVGGSLWYGNVKSTQEPAKNTFEAIDNMTAFAP